MMTQQVFFCVVWVVAPMTHLKNSLIFVIIALASLVSRLGVYLEGGLDPEAV
ncbi:expressed unknown protein [Ectocarpus siliculosus]|uniref:Uncharacterized protein n=1 Tax=Ectocarpus siliculosus TaxID=2880 RepID=D8LHJ4_ECTSI|nr:expressed unknown protein [Ectocarpus siliculosus]|eukprot:CBN79276.1 expressed unknown protein [Ectocarpus siliculosus]